MSDSGLETVLRRDRALTLAALAAVTGLAWVYVLRLAETMPAMPPASGMSSMGMSGMGMAGIAEPVLRPWGVVDALVMFSMWSAMMVGMMLPSAAPMILIYARVARQAVSQGKTFAATTWFAAGYLVAWTAFALLATIAQWGLESALLLTPALTSASSVLGGLILIGAGLYQWSPLKHTCLSQCQAPFLFIQRHGGFRREPAKSLALGARHGLYCIGCCWALMALLFVGGVMNLLWIAGLALLVLTEKIVPTGRWIPRISGVMLMGAGAFLLMFGGAPPNHL